MPTPSKDPHSRPKQEGNAFDKILKENIVQIIPALLAHVTEIEPFSIVKRLTEKLQTTTEREVDFLAKVKGQSGREFLLHVEFEVISRADIHYRMNEYHGIILRKYKLPIEHVVVYLGATPYTRRQSLFPDQVFQGYKLLNLKTLPFWELIQSETPEEVLLAILADFDTIPQNEAVRIVVQKLRNMTKDDTSRKKYLNQLSVLSGLRKLDSVLSTEIQKMPLTIDISENVFFKEAIAQGLEQGLKQGLKQGLEEGLEKGLEEGLSEKRASEALIAKKLMQKGFSHAEIAEVMSISEKALSELLGHKE